MPVFITSKTSATRHGVYALEQSPPTAVIVPDGDTICFLGQFEWGPMQVLTTIENESDLRKSFMIGGCSRITSAYLMMIAAGRPRTKIVRVVGAGAVKASKTLANAVPTTICTVTLKYEGTLGNSVAYSVEDASDGDANHFNLRVTLSNVYGFTEDLLENLSFNGSDNVVPSLTNALLVGAIAKNANGRPINATGTFAGGTSPAVVSSDYVGTAGAGDKGMSLLEATDDCDHFLTDDCGASIRDAVVSGGKAHVALMGDRIFHACDDDGNPAATVQAYAATNSSTGVVLSAPWVYIRDDYDGTERPIPTSIFTASVAAQLPPSTSIAWGSDVVRAMLGRITRLSTPTFGSSVPALTKAGVVVVIPYADGFCFESDVVTINGSTPSKGNLRRTRSGTAIALALKAANVNNKDAPNVEAYQDDVDSTVRNLLSNLKRARSSSNPAAQFFIYDYAIGDRTSVNTTSSILGGEYSVPIQIQTAPAMEKIFFMMEFGTTVTIRQLES